MSPIISGGGGGGGSRPFIDETDTGIVVNRAGGFVSTWETFDLLEPGVGMGQATVTAATADGETWAVSITPFLEVESSLDGVTWFGLYGLAASSSTVQLLVNEWPTDPTPVGAVALYVTFTPRFIRFRAALSDPNTGLLYAGANNPSFTFTLHYTAS